MKKKKWQSMFKINYFWSILWDKSCIISLSLIPLHPPTHFGASAYFKVYLDNAIEFYLYSKSPIRHLKNEEKERDKISFGGISFHINKLKWQLEKTLITRTIYISFIIKLFQCLSMLKYRVFLYDVLQHQTSKRP